KPLTLILHSALDHNGAFHRDPNLTAVITNATMLTLLVEGKESLAEIAGELRPLAHAYGQGDKIGQVMLAGHGNAQIIEMGGQQDAEGNIPDDPIDSAHNRAATDAFFTELLHNMASGPDSRVVLNACLTASNTVNTPLDPDPARAAAQ